MPPKFRKSAEYLHLTIEIETEVLDAYADVLESTGMPDFLLKNVSDLLKNLKIPDCFTHDVTNCIEWFYATRKMKFTRESQNWPVAEQLLRHLTISILRGNTYDVVDIVDIDKLVKFCIRLLKFRDNFKHILQNWTLFVEASETKHMDLKIKTNGEKAQECKDRSLTLQDLVRVKTALQLNDISDSILIDMLGCSRSDVDGEIFNYKLSSGSLMVNIKDFAEILGLLGHYDQ